jgi:hypothetical protein
MKMLIVSPAICLGLAGCYTQTPIIAGAVDTVGVSASVGPTDQGGGSFTFGYKGAKVAVVPVEAQNGNTLLLKKADGSERSFSVFAMLGVDAKGGVGPGVGLEQVVAVGPAAEIWAARAPILVVNNGQVQSVPAPVSPIKPGT